PQPRVLVAEDERNERRVLLRADEGGYGLDAVWADDLHHHLRRLAAGDSEGYFASYTGTTSDVAKTLRQGWFYEGQVSPHSGEARGTPADGIPPQRFVHCLQNHDQVGNRAFGDRLTDGVEPAVYRALSALLLLSPYTPLLWMGQEWAATAPFLYFTDHPEELGKLVTEGRREEFGHFSAFADPDVRERIPDPQSPDTFEKSKLRWEERESGQHAGCLTLYGELLGLRNRDAVLRERSRDRFTALELGDGGLALRRDGADGALLLIASFGGSLSVELGGRPELTAPRGGWSEVLSTEEERFGGAGKSVPLSLAGTVRMDGPGAVILRSGGTAGE
ncbi:MAG: DUF3459 domain-containing protein, partial [Gemmatimonadetes bacterium]|nr:DUF3459 domain-containing protein [Gemmatimonadota bacterium]